MSLVILTKIMTDYKEREFHYETCYPENLGPEAFRILGLLGKKKKIIAHVNSTVKNVY
jgi:hypothetical protein